MRHYHVVASIGDHNAVASVKFDKYEDSIEKFVNLANVLFSEMQMSSEDALALENAKEATDYGNGYAATVGCRAVQLYWMNCPGSCASATWN